MKDCYSKVHLKFFDVFRHLGHKTVTIISKQHRHIRLVGTLRCNCDSTVGWAWTAFSQVFVPKANFNVHTLYEKKKKKLSAF